MGPIKGICIFLSNTYWIVGHKSFLSVPNTNLFAFSHFSEWNSPLDQKEVRKLNFEGLGTKMEA